MGLNRDFIDREYKSEIVITAEDVASYASAIGANDKITNPIAAPPCFSAAYELPLIYKILEDTNLHGSKEQFENNMLMMVHGDQHLKFYNPINPSDEIAYYAKIEDIEDRGSGEVLRFRVFSTNQNGDKVVESNWGLFIRGIGSGKRPERRSPKTKYVLDSKKLIFTKTIKIPLDITHKYSKASNDMNPIHLDDEFAKGAGLPGIVVHGMCTMAMTAEGFVADYLNNNSSNLLSLGVRFAAPVFPGDELQIEASTTSEDNKLAFHVVRKSDGIRVIRDGLLETKI